MKCDRFPVPGAFAIVCSRGRRESCATPGCGRSSTKLCDFPVTRKGKAGTCDRKMCDRCAHRQPAQAGDTDTRDYCRPHHEMAQKRVGVE